MKAFFTLIEYLRQYSFLRIFTIYLRYLIGGTFVFASIVKIKGERFTSISVEHPIGFFFEAMYQTGLYWQFIGWAQLLGGLLLMTQYFAPLGALIYFILILNIFLITYSLAFVGTPFITFMMLMATIYLICWDWRRFLPLLTESRSIEDGFTIEKKDASALLFWAILGLVIFTTTVLVQILQQGQLFIWLILCFLEGLAGLVLFYIIIKKKPAA